MASFKKRFIFVGVVFAFVIGTLYYHAVDNSLSEDDKRYIPKYLINVGPLPENPTYSDELDYILSVQHSVLEIAENKDGIPFDQGREPKDVYESKTGLCYDRSRVIEKILRYSGFKTRHVSIYSKVGIDCSLKALIKPGISSHAVTEVLTRSGWLIVDSNSLWVSTDRNDQPVCIESVYLSLKNSLPIQWSTEPPSEIYLNPFIFVYGLYSRHGRFYPPYNLIPDIHYGEFIQNVL